VNFPRLPDDEVMRLVKRVQSGSASRDEKDELAKWMWGKFYRIFIREGYDPEEAKESRGGVSAHVAGDSRGAISV
jgi:hypothetical protein